jgi:hypothetical protein
MPISHDVAVSPGGGMLDERLVNTSADGIRGINRATLLNSQVIAGRSPELVASLVGIRRSKG